MAEFAKDSPGMLEVVMREEVIAPELITAALREAV